jgi:hypothetical protein
MNSFYVIADGAPISGSTTASNRPGSHAETPLATQRQAPRLGGLEDARRGRRSVLQACSIERPPYGDAMAGGVIEGQVKLRRQIIGVKQDQPNASRREVPYPALDGGALLKHDYTPLETAVPRGESPFKAYVHKNNFQLPRGRNFAVVSRLSKPIFLCDAASTRGWRHRDKGAAIFRQACAMGLEVIVSKRLSGPYRSGPSRDWLKIKNPDSSAMIRVREREW